MDRMSGKYFGLFVDNLWGILYYVKGLVTNYGEGGGYKTGGGGHVKLYPY